MGQGLLLLRKRLSISQLVVSICFSSASLIFLGVCISFLLFSFSSINNISGFFCNYFVIFYLNPPVFSLLPLILSPIPSWAVSTWLWGGPISPQGLKREVNILNFIVNVIPCSWDWFFFWCVCIFPMPDNPLHVHPGIHWYALWFPAHAEGRQFKASVVLLCGNVSWGPAAGAARAKLSLGTATTVWD